MTASKCKGCYSFSDCWQSRLESSSSLCLGPFSSYEDFVVKFRGSQDVKHGNQLQVKTPFPIKREGSIS